MFIYDYLIRSGHQVFRRLVADLKKRGVSSFVVIDSKEGFLDNVALIMAEEKVNMSVAIPYESFVEGSASKEEGYFIAGKFEDIQWLYSLTDHLEEQYISMIDTQTVHSLYKKNVGWVTKVEKGYFDRKNLKNVSVRPLAFYKAVQKQNCEKVFGEVEEVSLDEALVVKWTNSDWADLSMPANYFVKWTKANFAE